MEPRSFKRIASLPPAERIPFISEGLALLAQNVAELLQEAKFCWPEAPRASAIAGSVAAEEAAKALMLVDYLRPPKGVDDARLSEQLGSVIDHVARGVYVESYEGRPVDFPEMRCFLDLVRQPYYLDGPTGYDYSSPRLRSPRAERSRRRRSRYRFSACAPALRRSDTDIISRYVVPSRSRETSLTPLHTTLFL